MENANESYLVLNKTGNAQKQGLRNKKGGIFKK